MGSQFDGLAQIAEHISRLQVDIRTLRSIKLVDLRLTYSPLPISKHCRRIHLDECREVINGTVEILEGTVSDGPLQQQRLDNAVPLGLTNGYGERINKGNMTVHPDLIDVRLRCAYMDGVRSGVLVEGIHILVEGNIRAYVVILGKE